MNEVIDAVRKLVKAKGRYHTEQNYKALADALAEYDRRAAPTDVGEDRQSAIWSAIENYAHASAVYAYGTTRADAAQQRQAKEDACADLRAQLAARGQGDPEADFDKWMEKRGPLGAGAVPERIFFAGWSAGNRAATPQPAALKEQP